MSVVLVPVSDTVPTTKPSQPGLDRGTSVEPRQPPPDTSVSTQSQTIPEIVVTGPRGGGGQTGSGGGYDTYPGDDSGSGGSGGGGGSVTPEQRLETIEVIGQRMEAVFGSGVSGKIRTMLNEYIEKRPDILNFLATHEIQFRVLEDNVSTEQFGHTDYQGDQSNNGVAIEGSLIVVSLNVTDINAKIQNDLRHSDQWEISFIHEIAHPLLGEDGLHDGSMGINRWIEQAGYDAGLIADSYEAVAWRSYFH